MDSGSLCSGGLSAGGSLLRTTVSLLYHRTIGSDPKTTHQNQRIGKGINPYPPVPEQQLTSIISTRLQTCWEKGHLFIFAFSDNNGHLLELSRDQNNENPKLKRLEEILKEHFQSSQGSRGIIFTRTRQSTHSLHNWITSNSTLKELKIKSAALTGAGFSNQTKHMTQVLK